MQQYLTSHGISNREAQAWETCKRSVRKTLPSDKKIWIRVERSGVAERSSKNLKGNTWEKGELLEILGLRRDLEIFKLIDKCEDNKILKP
ncbi:MAG: hypothetical protein LM586_04785 [Desulfurococcales archaeon]|nr:hypothetical protein [Desulfurococcales archaeon]